MITYCVCTILSHHTHAHNTVTPHTRTQYCHTTHTHTILSHHTHAHNTVTPHTRTQYCHTTHTHTILSHHTHAHNTVTPHTRTQYCHTTHTHTILSHHTHAHNTVTPHACTQYCHTTRTHTVSSPEQEHMLPKAKVKHNCVRSPSRCYVLHPLQDFSRVRFCPDSPKIPLDEIINRGHPCVCTCKSITFAC